MTLRKFFLPAILALFFVTGALLSKATSPTTDEVAFHIANGFAALKAHDFRMNPASPPFAREWVALPWFFSNAKLNLDGPDWKEGDSVPFGRRVVFEDNRAQADKLLFFSRLMNVLLGMLLISVVFFWSRDLWGETAAFLSAILTGFTPAIMAHASIAGTDLPVTVFGTLSLYLLWKYSWASESLERKQYFILCTLSLGLAQACKFTALLLFPIFFFYLIKKKSFLSGVLRFAVLLAGSYCVVWASYFFEFKPLLQDVPRVQEKLGYITAIVRALGGDSASAAWWSKLALDQPIPLPSYLLGVAGIVRSHQEPYLHYYAGAWTYQVQWFYYLWTFAVKMTPGFLGLLLLRVFYLKKLAPLQKDAMLLLMMPVGLLFLVTLKDSTAVGVRYMLPVIPLLAVWMGETVTRNLKIRTLAVGLLCVHTFFSFQALPYSLEYFNFLIGGGHNAYRYVRGADLDWGQGLKYLKNFTERNRIERIALRYFGTADPSLYGIPYREVAPAEETVPKDEIYVVSVHFLEHLKWVAGREPDYRLGGSIFIYDMRQQKAALK